MKGVDLARFVESLERSRRPREPGGCGQPSEWVNLPLDPIGRTAAGTSNQPGPIPISSSTVVETAQGAPPPSSADIHGR
jgi:hypothetical protein